MASLNRVYLAGRLTRDPEVRFLPSGMAVGDLSMAISERFRNKAGEPTESVCFVDVVVWGKQAETCEKYLSKGSPLLVEGSLQQDKWKTKEGENRTKLRVKAQRVQFLGAPRGGAEFRDGKERGDAEARGAAAADEPPAQEEAPPDNVPPDGGAGDDDNLPF